MSRIIWKKVKQIKCQESLDSFLQGYGQVEYYGLTNARVDLIVKQIYALKSKARRDYLEKDLIAVSSSSNISKIFSIIVILNKNRILVGIFVILNLPPTS